MRKHRRYLYVRIGPSSCLYLLYRYRATLCIGQNRIRARARMHAHAGARVGVAAAATDWPKRIRDLQFLDHEGDPTAAYSNAAVE